jgi:hypothetical protein
VEHTEFAFRFRVDCGHNKSQIHDRVTVLCERVIEKVGAQDCARGLILP